MMHSSDLCPEICIIRFGIKQHLNLSGSNAAAFLPVGDIDKGHTAQTGRYHSFNPRWCTVSSNPSNAWIDNNPGRLLQNGTHKRKALFLPFTQDFILVRLSVKRINKGSKPRNLQDFSDSRIIRCRIPA